MVNSRDKGQRAELAFCEQLRTHLGISARRGQQFQGSPDSPDVITDLKGIHFEVKWYANGVSPWKALEQAQKDKGKEQIAVAGLKKNRGDWLICLRVEDLPVLVKQLKEKESESV